MRKPHLIFEQKNSDTQKKMKIAKNENS